MKEKGICSQNYFRNAVLIRAFYMQMYHILLQKGERIIVFFKFKSWLLTAHPHTFLFYILWESNIWNTQEIDGFPYLYYHLTFRVFFFFFLSSLCGTSLIWSIHWETFLTHRSLWPILIHRTLWRFIMWQFFLHIVFSILSLEWLKHLVHDITEAFVKTSQYLQSPQVSDKS